MTRASRDQLEQLVGQVEPGGRLVRARRLRGGVGARMDVLDIERADGTRTKVSLRRFPRDNRSSQPEHVAHEYRILQLVERTAIASPQPLLLDATGELFGVPAMALTYLPGAPVYQPHNVATWAEQLARALLAVHAVTPRTHDLSWLGTHLGDGIREELATRRARARGHSALAHEVHAALVKKIDRVAWPEPTFVHDDYWPGNTVWYHGRLTGVIDWTHAEVGDPRTDVSQCCLDLTMILDLEAAATFRAAYQRLAPRPLPDLWSFDLLRGLRALLSYQFWLAGYHDAGLTHVTKRRARSRIESFLRRALAAATR